jgi:hypothetical protein
MRWGFVIVATSVPALACSTTVINEIVTPSDAGHGGADSSGSSDASAGDDVAADDGPSEFNPGYGVGPDADGPTCSPVGRSDAGLCNGLQLMGDPVIVDCTDDNGMPTPTPTTMPIPDGFYNLLLSTTFPAGCDQAEQDRETVFVCGSSWQSYEDVEPALQESTVTPAVHVMNATIGATSAGMLLTSTCGQPPSNLLNYAYDFGQGNFTGFRLFTYISTNSGTSLRVDSFELN